MAKKNIQEKFIQYFEFLKNNPDIDNILSLDKYKSYLIDEKQKNLKYFEDKIKLYTFQSFDTEKIFDLFIDWYSTLKVINKETNYSKNPYFSTTAYLDNIIKSLGIEFPELISQYVKPQFSLDIVNLYKIKGTYKSIKDILTYVFFTPLEIYEVWLEYDLKPYAVDINDKELFFKSYPIKSNFTTGTSYDLSFKNSYESFTDDDPHWYYEKEDLLELVNNNDIPDTLKLPSLTPYFKIAAAPNYYQYYHQLSHINRLVNDQYIYFMALNQDNDFNKYQLLYHEHFGQRLSLLEITSIINYLWCKKYGITLYNKDNNNILFNRVELPESNYNNPDDPDHYILTKYYDYKTSKIYWDNIFKLPESKNVEDIEYSFIKENNNIELTNNYKYISKTLITNEHVVQQFLNILISDRKSYKDFSITYNNKYIFICGGTGVENIKCIDKMSLSTSFDINLNQQLKFSCSYANDNNLILFGGMDSNNILNNKLYMYNLIEKILTDIEYNYLYYNCLTYKLNNNYMLLIGGYDINNVYQNYIRIMDINNLNIYRYTINLSLLNKHIDCDMNDNNEIYIMIQDLEDDQHKLLKINLDILLSYIPMNISNNPNIHITSSKILLDNYLIDIDIDIENTTTNFCCTNNNNEYYIIDHNKCYHNKDNIIDTYSFSNNLVYKDNDYDNRLFKIKNNYNNYSYIKFSLDGNIYFQNIILEKQQIKDSLNDNTNIKCKGFIYNEKFNTREYIKHNYNYYLTLFNLITSTKYYIPHNYSPNDNSYNYILGDSKLVNMDIDTDNLNIISNHNSSDILNNSSFLDLLNPKLKVYADLLLTQSDKDFNYGLYSFIVLLDLFIKQYYGDESYFTQSFLTMDENLTKIINMFKPIYSRYQKSLSNIVTDKTIWNYLTLNCYHINKVSQNNHELISPSDILSNISILAEIIDIPYGAERSMMFDNDKWRDVKFTFLLKEIVQFMSIEKFNEIISLLDNSNIIPKQINDEYIRNILTDIRSNYKNDIEKITIELEKIVLYCNYNHETQADQPRYDLTNELIPFTHDSWILTDRLNVTYIDY